MNTVAELTPREYYRLPWSLTDNAISWLEVTDDCNLECEGCYRPHLKNHKSLAQIAEELAVFKERRKSDCMSLAGGDPHCDCALPCKDTGANGQQHPTARAQITDSRAICLAGRVRK